MDMGRVPRSACMATELVRDSKARMYLKMANWHRSSMSSSERERNSTSNRNFNMQKEKAAALKKNAERKVGVRN